MDELKQKYDQIIAPYESSVPVIDEESVKQQLNKIQDSYNTLSESSREIKIRLENTLSQFQNYKNTVQNITNNLDELESKITETTDVPIDLEECKLLHSSVQVSKKLYFTTD